MESLFCPKFLTEHAANLFGDLRAVDAKSARAIAAMPIPTDGSGEGCGPAYHR